MVIFPKEVQKKVDSVFLGGVKIHFQVTWDQISLLKKKDLSNNSEIFHILGRLTLLIENFHFQSKKIEYRQFFCYENFKFK